MKARANTDNRFLYKYLLIGIATLLYSLYCFYDAFLNYPAQRPASVAYDTLLEDIDQRKEDAPDADTNWAEVRESEWKQMAEPKGWDIKPPRYTAEELKHNIQFSIGLGGVCALIAVPCILWFLSTRGTWLEIDGTRLSSSSGQSLDFSDIQTLDKKKWVKKGLADIHYLDNGAEKCFVLDDLKYERAVVDQMIAEVEKSISPDKIINGPTEVEIARQREAALAARQKKLAEMEADEESEEA
jgi:hypothetical protein